MSEIDMNMIKAFYQGIPEWEAVLLAEKDPTAEAFKWLLNHGFIPLYIGIPNTENLRTWVRTFGMWKLHSMDELGSPAYDNAIRLLVTKEEFGWDVVLESRTGRVADRRKCRASGDTPAEALGKLAEQIQLTDIIKRAIGEGK